MKSAINMNKKDAKKIMKAGIVKTYSAKELAAFATSRGLTVSQ